MCFRWLGGVDPQNGGIGPGSPTWIALNGHLCLLVIGGWLFIGHSVANGTQPTSGTQGAKSQSFAATGVVRELRPEIQSVVVAHEAISNYMVAMTMPFRLQDTNALHQLHTGDRIAFDLHVTDDQSWIDHISTIGHSQITAEGSTKSVATEVKPPKAHHPLLDYPFTNELGQAMTLGQFRGQALAITFFFTRCPIPDYCPRLSKNFEEASRTLLARENAPTNWHFLSVSFDSEFDTPARLKAYGEQYQYNPAHWSFLTGPRDKIAELAAQSGANFEPDTGFFTHNFRTLIIDAAGHLQTAFPIGGNLSEAIVSEILKAAMVSSSGAR